MFVAILGGALLHLLQFSRELSAEDALARIDPSQVTGFQLPAANALFGATAEEVVDRLVFHLAQQVPERDVDGADRVYTHALARVVDARAPHLLPDVRDVSDLPFFRSSESPGASGAGESEVWSRSKREELLRHLSINFYSLMA